MDVLLVILIVMAVAGLYFMVRDSGKIKAAFTKIALKCDGIVRKVFASYPQLEFEYDGEKALVSAIHGANGPFTYLTYRVSHWIGVSEFIIISRAMPTKIMNIRMDLKNHETQDKKFDSKFISRCHDAGAITSMLCPDLRKLLLELNDGKSTEVRFLKERDTHDTYRFDLHVERILTEPEEYEKLINTALQILQRLRDLAA